MIWLDILFLVVLLVVFPVVVARGFPAEMRSIADGVPRARISGYRGTMKTQWPLCVAGVAIWIVGGRSLHDLGFRPPEGWGFWAAAAIAAIIAAFLTAQLRSARSDDGAKRELRAQLGGSAVFLPRDRGELAAFAQLSATAGICEEILYRGWLLGWLAPLIGMPAAIVTGAALFGAAHSYGGRGFVLKAGGMGILFGVLYALSGSLWVPIALHIFVDVSSGMLSVEAFRDAETREVVA